MFVPRVSRSLETILWAAFGVSAAYGAYCVYQAAGTSFAAPVRAGQRASETDGPIVGAVTGGSTYTSGPAIEDGTVIGSLSVPALQLNVPVVEGMTKNDLLRGIGHVPGSATAGGLGNMALAAHRDTFFRPLRNVKPGMVVAVASADGTYKYKVDSTEVVSPEQVSVLEIGTVPQVTLITCYPFDFIGAAPKRFIVHAHLTSLVPDAR